MKCQNCGKEEATVRYYENINGEKREIVICANCAKNLNLIDFPNMLSYFFISHPKELIEDEYSNKVCSKCSYTFDDYLEKGLFGCPNCYNAFSDRIDTLLTKIHGKNRHLNIGDNTSQNNFKKTGVSNSKISENSDISKIEDVNSLKKLLDKSIKEEKYEDAAKLRDRIKELEK
ncbi:MAG: putative repair protein [Clostridia bacterium]|jgi:protein arginine kinase activator|nr:putative repair protein [Clostridia bacterium]